MALNIDDLGIVCEELIDIRAKSYNLGLQLKVSVGTLDSITRQYPDHSDQLRETLKACIPDLPHTGSALVMADSNLTSVGGKLRSGKVTNSLLSLIGKGRDSKWVQHFTPMGQKRWHATAICYDFYLVVAGGSDGHNRLAAVEVMNMDTLQWCNASFLPHPFSDATASICGERLYMLCGFDHTGPTRSVLTCSMSELIHSCQILPQTGKPFSPSKNTVWKHIADSPYGSPSCTTVCMWTIGCCGRK